VLVVERKLVAGALKDVKLDEAISIGQELLD
jgi:hypothetical protein